MSQQEYPASVAILEQLNRIVSSGNFDASERNRRFLHYIVTETLDGRADRIKAYCIATAVFERDAGFDPQTDPIIRIEASRLRRALDYYYLTAGQGDPIRISVPKGSYVPSFACVPAPLAPLPAPTQADGRRRIGLHMPSRAVAASVFLVLSALGGFWMSGVLHVDDRVEQLVAPEREPRILVAPLEADSATANHADLAAGLTREIVAGLARFEDLFVVAPETSVRNGTQGGASARDADSDLDYIVSGGLSAMPGRIRVTVALIDARSHQILWSEAFEGDISTSDPLRIRAQIADRVVRALAEPYGVIFSIWSEKPGASLPAPRAAGTRA